jgi:hypothetical protein
MFTCMLLSNLKKRLSFSGRSRELNKQLCTCAKLLEFQERASWNNTQARHDNAGSISTGHCTSRSQLRLVSPPGPSLASSFYSGLLFGSAFKSMLTVTWRNQQVLVQGWSKGSSHHGRLDQGDLLDRNHAPSAGQNTLVIEQGPCAWLTQVGRIHFFSQICQKYARIFTPSQILAFLSGRFGKDPRRFGVKVLYKNRTFISLLFIFADAPGVDTLTPVV